MPKAPAVASPRDPLREEAGQRLDDAKQQKRFIQPDLWECYFFAAPRRLRSPSSDSNQQSPTKDDKELQTSMGFEVADEFMTLLIESFMPQAAKWAERQADASTPEGQRKTVETEAKKGDEAIFQLIRASNFHAELARGGVPDASIGVIAMDIRGESSVRPPRCLAVPIRELEMNIGPDGRVDDRFQIRRTKYRSLRAVLPKDVTLPKEINDKISDDKHARDRAEVRWGYWRLWERDDDEHWQHVVMVDSHVVHSEIFKGIGSCPLSIGRFGGTPDFAWPDGPMVKSLPELRTLDEVRAALIENLDFNLRPPFTYDDDGVLNFEDGVESGMAYPRRPGGGRETIQELYAQRRIDAELFQVQELERRIKRLHYVDFPEQQGKTPPTATQWLDEMVESQKKIGTPGYAFWREFPFEAFHRFRYLAEKRGAIKPIMVNGQPISLQAYNPAQRAQENQEVLTATRLLQIAGSAFPQVMQAAVDPLSTITNIQQKLGDKLVTIRSKDDLQQAVSQVAQLTGVGGPKQGPLTGDGAP